MDKMYALYIAFIQLAHAAMADYNQPHPSMGMGGNPPPQALSQGVGFQQGFGGAQASPLQICASLGPDAVQSVRCSNVSQNDMMACFGSRGQDQTIASLIRTCPAQLPSDFFASAMQLRSSNLPLSFSALLSNNRCNERLTEAQKHHLLQVLLKDDDAEYTRMALQSCQIQQSVLEQYADIAQKFGWVKSGADVAKQQFRLNILPKALR